MEPVSKKTSGPVASPAASAPGIPTPGGVPAPGRVDGGSNPVVDVAKHGGTPNGKVGIAGSVPGTPEHEAIKRAAAASYKREYRARKRAENPPTIPAAIPSAGQSPANAPAPVAGDQGSVSAAPFVPWNAAPLRPLVEGLVSTAEQARVAKRTTAAAKARLPREMLEAIEKNNRWNPLQKTALAETGPTVIADAMEAAGISGKWQPLTIFGITIATLFFADMQKGSETDRLIADYLKAKESPPTQEKKP